MSLVAARWGGQVDPRGRAGALRGVRAVEAHRVRRLPQVDLRLALERPGEMHRPARVGVVQVRSVGERQAVHGEPEAGGARGSVGGSARRGGGGVCRSGRQRIGGSRAEERAEKKGRHYRHELLGMARRL